MLPTAFHEVGQNALSREQLGRFQLEYRRVSPSLSPAKVPKVHNLYQRTDRLPS